MLEHQLRDQLANVADRIGRLWLWRRLTWCWFGAAAVLAVWFLAGAPSAVSIGILGAGSVLAATLVWARSKALRLPRLEVARTVEQAFPDLNSRLLAALEQSPDMASGRLNVLQRQVMAEALHHSRINDWAEAVPTRRMRSAFLRQLTALAGFLLVCGYVWPAAAQKSAGSPDAAATEVDPEQQPVIEPGSIDLERGSNLLVLARFLAAPSKVQLVWTPDGGAETVVGMTKSLDDPIFAGQLGTVDQPLTYRVEFDGRRSPEFRVTVFDLPALVRSDLELRFPGYTGLEARRLEDAFIATVVEGSTICLTCRLNKPGIVAALVDSNGASFPLQPDAENPLLYRADFQPTGVHRLTLKLVDDAGRQNRDPEDFRFEARPNQPPEITLTFPSKDVKVSPLEEVPVEATVWDDFGLISSGVVFTVPGREPMTVELGQNLRGGDKHTISSLQRLEDMKVEPDDLVSYYFYADDHGPDGQPRRTTSDLFLAEVRPFEEIFRQMQAPPGGQSQSSGAQSGSPTEKLMELQKQIMIATWKLVRPPRGTVTPQTLESAKVIQESQQKAIAQFEQMAERITAAELQSTLRQIGTSMAEAETQFGLSQSESSFAPLDRASGAVQVAYQGLLKLRAREHLLMQSQQQSGSGSGASSSVSQEQLSQLELDNRKNRYEMQRSARTEGEASQREELAVLDRLKELARRQEGINEKLKEVEARLRSATTDAEREELERQLKRLRDEQQQLLHDADEVRDRMAQSARQEQMAETRNQLEQTRQRMVDTADKLQEGQLSQALNSGTRAERELKQLQEEFRNQTAGRFADAMRSLRETARELDEHEQQLSERLNQAEDESRHSLRQSRNRQSLEEEFREQRRQAQDLVDEARQIVEDAEQAEPLLAKQLYDTLRTTRESKVDEALDATAQLLKAGFLPEARRAETQVREGISRLRTGIETAAEAVLGNEVEALKRARAELSNLSEELDRELAAQGGKPSENEGQQGEGQQGQGQQGQGQQGQGQQGQGQQGQGQQGQGQQGQGQQGQGQQGQGQQGQGQQGQGQQGQGQQGQGQQGQGQQGQGQQGQGQQGQGQQGQGQQGQGAGRQPPGLRNPSGGQPQPGRAEGSDQGGMGGGPGGQGGPLTGSNFSEFSERLRDVESMVSDPALQAEVARIRERARSLRAEFKRHSQTPNWDLVRTTVHEPMIQLQKQLSEEILRREEPESLVPVDRDPVPPRFQSLVKEYYERLGSGKEQ